MLPYSILHTREYRRALSQAKGAVDLTDTQQRVLRSPVRRFWWTTPILLYVAKRDRIDGDESLVVLPLANPFEHRAKEILRYGVADNLQGESATRRASTPERTQLFLVRRLRSVLWN